jgi:hypothetical protein
MPRSGTVRFECGQADELFWVTEPAPCRYEAAMRSPAACSVHLLRRRLADLRAAMRGVGRDFSPSPEARALLGEPEDEA